MLRPFILLFIMSIVATNVWAQHDNADSLQIQTDSLYQTLSEAVVTTQKPYVKLHRGRVHIDVPQLIKGTGVTNVFEALGQTPGLQQAGENLEMIGVRTFAILINGQSSDMSKEQLILWLQTMPVERLAAVELMYMAPPETGIKGAAVNVLLRELTTDRQSLQGNMLLSTTYEKAWKANTATNLFYTKGKWQAEVNLAGNLFNRRKNGEEMEARHSVNDTVYRLLQHNSRRRTMPQASAYTSLIYQPNSRHKLNMRYYYSGSRTRTTIWADMNVNDVSGYHSVTVSRFPTDMHHFTLAYTAPQYFDLTLRYANVRTETDSEFEERGRLLGITGETASHSASTVNTYHLRVSRSADSIGQVGLVYGLNGYHLYSHTQTRYRANAQWQPQQLVKLSEWSLSPYLGVSWQPDSKLSLNAYLGIEYYLLRDAEGKTYGEHSYWQPRLGLSYMPGEAHMWQIDLTADKRYADFADMLPTTRRLNPYNSVKGNPYLLPEKEYALRINYIHRRRHSLMFFLNYNADALAQQPYQEADRLQTVMQSVNLDYALQCGLSLHTRLTFKGVEGLNLTPQLAAIYLEDKILDFHGLNVKRGKGLWQGRLQVDYKLPVKPVVYCHVSARYTAPAIYGIYEVGSTHSVTAALTYQFMKSKAKLVLRAEDIFNGERGRTRVDYGGQWSRINQKNERPRLSLTFTYTFGGHKESTNDITTDRFQQK